jgi:hypothetical protein
MLAGGSAVRIARAIARLRGERAMKPGRLLRPGILTSFAIFVVGTGVFWPVASLALAADPPQATAIVFKSPSAQNLMVGGDSIIVDEEVAGVPGGPGLAEFRIDFKFDSSLVTIEVIEGAFLKSTGRATVCGATLVAQNEIAYACTSTGSESGPSGRGVLARFVLRVAPGVSPRPTLNNGFLMLLDDQLGGSELRDVDGNLIPLAQAYDALIVVRALEGDFNKDCNVNVLDTQAISLRYLAPFGTLLFDPFFDLEPQPGDGDIDIKDLQFVFGRNGGNCKTPLPTPVVTMTVVIPTVVPSTATPTASATRTAVATNTPTPTRTPLATTTPATRTPQTTPAGTRTVTSAAGTALPEGTVTGVQTPVRVITVLTDTRPPREVSGLPFTGGLGWLTGGKSASWAILGLVIGMTLLIGIAYQAGRWVRRRRVKGT